MTIDSVENEIHRYQLSEEQGQILNHLARLLERAEEERLHEVLGLSDAIRIRTVEEIPNHRDAVRKLLEQKLGTIDEADTETRELIADIIADIDKVNKITEELKKTANDDKDSKTGEGTA